MSYRRRMKVYQSTDTDRRSNPTTCGGDTTLETVFSMDPDGSGEPYQEMNVRLHASGEIVTVHIDTAQCGKGITVYIDGKLYRRVIS